MVRERGVTVKVVLKSGRGRGRGMWERNRGRPKEEEREVEEFRRKYRGGSSRNEKGGDEAKEGEKLISRGCVST